MELLSIQNWLLSGRAFVRISCDNNKVKKISNLAWICSSMYSYEFLTLTKACFISIQSNYCDFKNFVAFAYSAVTYNQPT